jgi:hypothetical protein
MQGIGPHVRPDREPGIGQRYRGCLATALGRAAGARMVDEHPAHDPGSQTEELRAVLPLHPFLRDEPHIGFVHETSGVE